ncbi:tissue inhibitor of metalloproteinase domain-containing protein [Ditylenchus destructor]|uniref:Tissue inhibitor of metalloproteinase domain-containing protein n=1 Tax=Ditylenchus destructor TaxID=166010 RepID=A0AAD4MFA4_9BILA|nr:tissue inhibitor of metalloproteinase domain-containing protein [Ditylenchus destructor]
MIKLILLLSLAIFLLIPKFTLACKCLALDFVDTLCHAGFVSHVKVDFKERYIGSGGHENFGHHVEHIEHFKDGDWTSIITTSGRDSTCGVNLTMGKEYLISGYKVSRNELRITKCDIAIEWDHVGTDEKNLIQRKNFQNCKAQICRENKASLSLSRCK